MIFNMKSRILNTIFISAVVLSACARIEFEGDAPKDWIGTTVVFTPAEEEAYSTYYKPALGRVGDPMPFYDSNSGEFKILYLQEYPVNDDKRFHPIWCVTTKDGYNYESMGEIIPVGESRLQQDAALGTGCVYYNTSEKLYYLYYTGHNGLCESREVLMRATSPDFKTWTKDNLWSLKGRDCGYSSQDFRDPQIFEDGGKFHMVVSTYRTDDQKDPRFLDFLSDNMKDWTFNGEFNMVWNRFCECPDIFKMGDWWYLVYSEAYKADFSRKVKYMKADSFEGLKKCFQDPGGNWPDEHEGILDTRAFYAAKTASNGKDRYIWGWCPYRTGNTYHDKNIAVGADGEPNWSGALVCHKLIQHSDGTLAVGVVPGMETKYSQNAELKVMDSKNYDNGRLTGDAYVLYNRLGYHNHISFTVKLDWHGDAFSVSFVRGTEKEGDVEKEVEKEVGKYYSLRFNPEWENGRRKVNFEQQGKAPDAKWFIPGADGYIFPIPAENTYKIDIFTDNSVVVTYINGDYGTTQRIYGIQKNCWSINSHGGNITVSDVKVTQY